MNFSKIFRSQGMANAALTIAAGLLLLLVPASLVHLVFGLIGWVVLLSGIFSTISVWRMGGGVLPGILQILFGLWVVRNPGGILSIAAVVIAVLLLIHGINDLQFGLNGRKAGAMGWLPAMVSGGVTAVLALLVLIQPFRSVMTVMSFAGICLIIDGIASLLMYHRMGKYYY